MSASCTSRLDRKVRDLVGVPTIRCIIIDLMEHFSLWRRLYAGARCILILAVPLHQSRPVGKGRPIAVAIAPFHRIPELSHASLPAASRHRSRWLQHMQDACLFPWTKRQPEARRLVFSLRNQPTVIMIDRRPNRTPVTTSRSWLALTPCLSPKADALSPIASIAPPIIKVSADFYQIGQVRFFAHNPDLTAIASSTGMMVAITATPEATTFNLVACSYVVPTEDGGSNVGNVQGSHVEPRVLATRQIVAMLM